MAKQLTQMTLRKRRHHPFEPSIRSQLFTGKLLSAMPFKLSWVQFIPKIKPFQRHGGTIRDEQ